jgi:Na+-driven multidrug efflux pump
MAAACIAVAVRHARRVGASLAPGLAGVSSSAIAGGWLLLRTASLRVALVATTVAATGEGTVALAATQVLLTLYFTLALALDAFAIAGQAMIGHALGGGDVARVRAVLRRLLGWGLVLSLALAVPIAALAGILGRVFTSDAGVLDAMPGGVLVLAASLPIGAVVFVLDGVLIGADDGRYLAWTGLVNLAVYLPLLWWATTASTAPAAVVAIQLAFCVGYLSARAVTLSLRVRGTRWMAHHREAALPGSA